MKIGEVMTKDVKVVAPSDTVRKAAQIMDDLNVGAVPVCDGQTLVGMVTDRDITVRSTSQGKAPDQCQVSDVMSQDVRYCYEDDPVENITQKMSDSQIRRVPVIDKDKKLVGIVSLGDLATQQTTATQAKDTLKDISQPSQPQR